MALRPYADLEEGEYTVLIRRTDPRGQHPPRSGGAPAPVKCTFSVAEFSLSPLIARLERHAFDAGRLRFGLRVMVLSILYDGKAELALQSGELVVETKQARVRDGLVEASFDVGKHEGPFRVQITHARPARRPASISRAQPRRSESGSHFARWAGSRKGACCPATAPTRCAACTWAMTARRTRHCGWRAR